MPINQSPEVLCGNLVSRMISTKNRRQIVADIRRMELDSPELLGQLELYVLTSTP